ncbi:hypothetical protein PTI98_006692 [Pleurotus ostreatus]|nr:hypothetical protein PTI98_006692 [Pleurotus ostreatus]
MPLKYPVFEAAITGRAALEGTWEDDMGSPSGVHSNHLRVSKSLHSYQSPHAPVQMGSLFIVESENPPSTFKRASGMIDMMPQTEEEMEAIRNAVINREGLLVSVFDVLRRVPRRVLMVLKLNDLTRHLDHALMTTHSNIRIFLITAKYCTFAVWQNDKRRLIDLMRDQGLISLSLLSEYFTSWWRFKKNYYGIVFVETIMDAQARLALLRAWTQGLWSMGFEGAHKAAAGLA